MPTDLFYLFLIWLSTLVIGWISWPSTAFFLGKLSDRGYGFAKIFGWVVISYLVFLLATLKIIPLSLWSTVLVVLIWAGINIFLEKKFRILGDDSNHFCSTQGGALTPPLLKRGGPPPLSCLRQIFRKSQKCLLSSLGLCAARFNLRQIIFTELLFIALMVFWAFVRSFKPEIYGIERFMDFGFIQALFNSNTLPLFDIWFSGENLNYYYFGHFIGYIILSLSKIPVIPGFFVLVAWMFGLLGILAYRLGADLFLALLPPPDPLLRKEGEYISQKIPPLLTKERGGGGVVAVAAGLISLFTVLFAGTWYMAPWIFNSLKHFLFGGAAPTFWFSDPTRIMPGTITEIPVYGFLVADLHPHMWGLLNGALVLAALYCLWRSEIVLNLKNRYFWAFAFLLGATFMLNSWDAVTLGALTVAVLGYIHIKQKKIKTLFIYIVLLAGFAYAIALPWSLFFSAPVSGIGFVRDHSSILQWLSFWGFLAAIAVIFLGKVLCHVSRPPLKVRGGTKGGVMNSIHGRLSSFHLVVIGAAVFFLIFMELFYVKDILSEGEWFRANTVFKITSQLWLWLGVLSGPMIVWSVISLKNLKGRIALIIIYFFIFLGPAVYPAKAIWQFQLDDRKPKQLSAGLDWWKEKYLFDYEAYEYLSKVRDALPKNDRVRRIVEAEGESYTDHARFSVFLGWPSIIGWPVHEWTWRGSYKEVGSRRSEARDIYTNADLGLTQSILEKYKIDYILVGELEEQLYGTELKQEKLKGMGKVVFEKGKTMVIDMRR